MVPRTDVAANLKAKPYVQSMNTIRTLACTTLLVSAALPSVAHHSFAMFDQTRQVTLKGKVVEFQWTNPHAFIHVEVPAPDGNETWDIELNSPNNLKRQGWKSTSVKPGDIVTLLANPLRDATHKGGLFISVTLADGTLLGEATRTGGGPINVPILPPK
jgi:Family of unknown function (DUF6152)